MAHLYVWHDYFICVTWLIHMSSFPGLKPGDKWCLCAARWKVCHDSFTCGTWLIHMCDMMHSHVWHDSSYVTINGASVLHAGRWAMTHARVGLDSFTCVPRLTHICGRTHTYVWDMTHAYVWHHSFMCVAWPIHMCDMTPLICVPCLYRRRMEKSHSKRHELLVCRIVVLLQN